MTSSQNKPIRVALLAYDIVDVTFHSFMLKRNGMTIIARESHTYPFDAETILPIIVEKNPTIFVIGRYGRIEEADTVAQQIKQFAPNTPILGSVAGKSDKQSKYLDDCLYMPTHPQDLQEAVIRLTSNTNNS